MARSTLALWAACSVFLACTRSKEPGGPVPLSVEPAQGTGRSALAVEIAGRDLDAYVRSDLSSSQGGSIDVGFAAVLEPAAGGSPVPLADVALTPRRTLRATVPAGVARGVYRLQVTDPRGRTGVLESAFRVVASAEAVTTFRVELLEAPRAGVPFTVAVSAVDAQGMLVDGFDGSASLSVSAGTLSAAAAGPFALGRVQVQETVRELVAGARITASDALGRSGASDPFDVTAGPPMAVVFPGRSVSATAGACSPPVAVELRDALGHPSPAEVDVTARLQASAGDVSFFSDAACTAALASLVLPAGVARASFHFRPAAAGLLTVRVVPALLPSASQDETVVSP